MNQVSGKDTNYKGLPTTGKWIKWKHRSYREPNGEEIVSWYKGEVMKYTDIIENTKAVMVKNMNGVDTNTENRTNILTQEYFQDQSNWSYCDIPGEEEIENSKWEGLNKKIGNRFCNRCNCSNKKLQICTGCYKVYYCDQTCQLDNWNSHKEDCKREKIVLKPASWYPLSEVSIDLKKSQARTQNEGHQILQAALNGNFTVKRTEGDLTVAFTGPKSSDLEVGKKYALNVINREFTFEWEGLHSMDHSIPKGHPTSCFLLEVLMKSYLKDVSMKEGGLHYLAGYQIFWFMLINFNTYGTVAPFYGPCICNPKNVKAQMPPELRELRKKWNKMFMRAKADINDVQCMYCGIHTRDDCHNFENCPYKHDVEWKKEKKKTPL